MNTTSFSICDFTFRCWFEWSHFIMNLLCFKKHHWRSKSHKNKGFLYVKAHNILISGPLKCLTRRHSSWFYSYSLKSQNHLRERKHRQQEKANKLVLISKKLNIRSNLNQILLHFLNFFLPFQTMMCDKVTCQTLIEDTVNVRSVFNYSATGSPPTKTITDNKMKNMKNKNESVCHSCQQSANIQTHLHHKRKMLFSPEPDTVPSGQILRWKTKVRRLHVTCIQPSK